MILCTKRSKLVAVLMHTHKHGARTHKRVAWWRGGGGSDRTCRTVSSREESKRESGGLKFETDSGIVRRCRECFRLRDSLGCSTISYVCLPHHDQLLRHIEQTPLLHRLILEQLVILYKPDWKEKNTYIRKRKTEMKQ